MIKTTNLKFSYSNQNVFSFPDIECKKSESLLILGKSGSGKTTMLNILGLLTDPESGVLEIAGKQTQKLNISEKTAFRALHVGLVYQKPYFINSLNVYDNLLIANYLAKKEKNYSRVEDLAKTLGFTDLLHKKVQNLSGGEQQRVAIARALMNQPSLVLADEPTSALDDDNCENVITLLEKEAQNVGSSLIIVTHDQRLKNRIKNQITLQ
jgi:putative ABC transport system ATP-binding protein